MRNKVLGGVLYVISTPIGNLDDITLRAIAHLKAAQVIYAEDTRVTKRLLQQLDITPPTLVSCHDHNESARVEGMLLSLAEGKIVALVSDAGTPLISDPGYHIVHQVRKASYPVIAIPGVSAVITALSVSGLPSDQFTFYGFFAAKSAGRKTQLKALTHPATAIFYESVHRLRATLADIADVLPQRSMVIAKELTKQFERFLSGCAEDILQALEQNPDWLKGEFVILIGGDIAEDQDRTQLEVSLDVLLKTLMKEMPLKKAVKVVEQLSSLKKNELYQRALELQEK
jgi:16S rRNA (cytidine1402-2'-O)-methyltransferase